MSATGLDVFDKTLQTTNIWVGWCHNLQMKSNRRQIKLSSVKPLCLSRHV
jgi:hypothetical protein